MKTSLALLLGITLCSGGCTAYVAGPPPPPVVAGPAVGVVVEDRPYYIHGPYYYSRGARYVWVAGHWDYRRGQRVWIHGHYVAP